MRSALRLLHEKQTQFRLQQLSDLLDERINSGDGKH
ncbi:type II toxin-antitoxin system ParD family antitoxin [Enterobacter hormaechei]|nr:type II toxin-antitoxin system ParD family antitoxin [Enterobacter hormaechei]